MLRATFAFVTLVGLVPFACGGESSTDGDTGGAGGSTTGGSSGTGGSGGAPSGGSGGSGGTNDCGPPPTGDCVVCGKFAAMVCSGGKWGCPTKVCPDAACEAGEVPTASGCLTCGEVSTKLTVGIEAARKANASCGSEADCVLTGGGTACAGSCQLAVSKTGEAAFQAALSKLDADYCKGFVPECGYSGPKCAVPKLVCTAGLCDVTFN